MSSRIQLKTFIQKWKVNTSTSTFSINKYTLLLNYILIMCSLINYFGYAYVWFTVLFCLILLIIFTDREIARAIFKHYFLIGISMILMLISIIVSPSNEFLFQNIISIEAPTILCVIMSALAITKRSEFERVLNSWVIVLNIWWIINLIVVYIQVNGNPVFIKPQWLTLNPLYEDNCCGLFGYNRTHELAFFSYAILICNLSKVKMTKSLPLLIYTLSTYLIMLWCSFYNDNVSFFILLPISLVLFLVLNNENVSKPFLSGIVRNLFYILSLIAVFIILLQIPDFSNLYEEYIGRRINGIIYNNQFTIGGSHDRFAVIGFALSESNTFLFGAGFGAETLGEHVAHGFVHFGQSILGSLLYLSGIWYCVFHTLLIAASFNDLFRLQEKARYYLRLILIFTALVIFECYSPILISVASIFWITLMFAYMRTSPESNDCPRISH